jgi:hypothetical protein
MLSLITNFKNLTIIGLLITCLTLFLVSNNRKNQIIECRAKNVNMQMAINTANDLKVNLERKLRLREQEAAKARAESLKRKDRIMQTEIKGGCEGAIQWMIDQAR